MFVQMNVTWASIFLGVVLFVVVTTDFVDDVLCCLDELMIPLYLLNA